MNINLLDVNNEVSDSKEHFKGEGKAGRPANPFKRQQKLMRLSEATIKRITDNHKKIRQEKGTKFTEAMTVELAMLVLDNLSLNDVEMHFTTLAKGE